MNLIERLSTECNFISDIHKGGCCVFAALVSEQLVMRGMRHAIKVAGACYSKPMPKYMKNDKKHGIKNSRRNFNEDPWRPDDAFADVHFMHVFISIGKIWFDNNEARSDRVVPTFSQNTFVYNGALTLEETMALAAENSWNPTFDRDYIPELRQKIQTIFRECDQLSH